MPAAPLSEEDRQLLDRAAMWRPEIGLRSLNADCLCDLTAREGVEMATGVLYDRLRRSYENGALIRKIEESDELLRGRPGDDPLLALVPGAFWQHYPHTGADGKFITSIAKNVVFKTEFVPVQSFGPLEVNARILLDWLARHRDRNVVMVSLSKGSQDLKTAITISNAEGSADFHFQRVRAWLSIGGSIQGTPLVDWLNQRPLRSAGLRVLLRLRGQRFEIVNELRREPGAPLWHWPALPDWIRVVHVLSFPLRRHLTHQWTPRGYERLASLGPNDGAGILLGDVTSWPGKVFPIWGVDHYLQPRWDITPILQNILLESAGPNCRTIQSPEIARTMPGDRSIQ